MVTGCISHLISGDLGFGVYIFVSVLILFSFLINFFCNYKINFLYLQLKSYLFTI